MDTVALSIDLEAWYHAQLVRPHVRLPAPDRVPEATRPLLDLLARRGVRATFFTVGEVLRDHPGLLREIRDAGHEVGCHGMTHRTLWELGPDAFAAELREFRALAREVLGDGAPLLGFRAPTFSVDRRTAWAPRLIHEAGFAYDSSVFPMRGPLYGVPGAPLRLYRVALDDPAREDPGSPLHELPLPVLRAGPLEIPAAGGVYFRLLPLPVFARLLARAAGRGPAVLYLHPWELDPGTPRVRAIAPALRAATYAGVGRALRKLDALLERFTFVPVADLLRGAGVPLPPPPA